LFSGGAAAISVGDREVLDRPAANCSRPSPECRDRRNGGHVAPHHLITHRLHRTHCSAD
jgi:hypothetical protein